MSMIRKTPTTDRNRDRPRMNNDSCEFHVAIGNKTYTHEMTIKLAIPTEDEYEGFSGGMVEARSHGYSM